MSTYSIHHMQERAKESKVRRKSREQRSSWYFAILCLWMWMKEKWQERRYENGKCLRKWIYRGVESERDEEKVERNFPWARVLFLPPSWSTIPSPIALEFSHLETLYKNAGFPLSKKCSDHCKCKNKGFWDDTLKLNNVIG